MQLPGTSPPLTLLKPLSYVALGEGLRVPTQAPTTLEFERGASGFQNRPLVFEISQILAAPLPCCPTHNPFIFGLGDFVKAQNGQERALRSLKSPPGNAILQNKKE